MSSWIVWWRGHPGCHQQLSLLLGLWFFFVCRIYFHCKMYKKPTVLWPAPTPVQCCWWMHATLPERTGFTRYTWWKWRLGPCKIRMECGVGGWISKKPWFLPHIVIHRENGGNVGVIPLTSKPIYTWKSGYLIGSQSTFSDLRIRWVQKQGYHGFGGWNLNKIHKFLNCFDVPNTPFSWCLW